MVTALTDDALRERAARVRLVVSDVDGVLTDGCVYYSEQGESLKRFSMRDGMGVERLREKYIETALLTRERTGFTDARALKLKIRHVWKGVHDKRALLETIERATGVPSSAMLYCGDDVNDLDFMRAVIDAGGLAAAPFDAMEDVLAVACYRSRASGGNGAFREIAEWLLRLRG